jgi:hypothetical protein
VEDFMKELGVVVEGISSCKNQQVSGEVAGEEENKGKSGHGHDNFAADRGFGEGTHGTERSIHGSLGHPAGAWARLGCNPEKTSGIETILTIWPL